MLAPLVATLLLGPMFAPGVWLLSVLVDVFIPRRIGLRRRIFFSVGIATAVAVIASTILLAVFGDPGVVLVYIVGLLLAAPVTLGARLVFFRAALLAEKKGTTRVDEDRPDTSL